MYLRNNNGESTIQEEVKSKLMNSYNIVPRVDRIAKSQISNNDNMAAFKVNNNPSFYNFKTGRLENAKPKYLIFVNI